MKAGLLFLVFYVAAALLFHVIGHLVEYLTHLVDRCLLAYLGWAVCEVGYIKCGAVAVA
jgi:hypothetical protein